MEVEKFSDLEIIEKVLGSGYISKVKLAKHKQTGHIYAIKIVNLKNIKKEEAESLNREISIQKTLFHEHIVRMINSFIVDNNLYIILEYVPNGTLFEFYKRTLLDDQKIARIFGQICSAIDSMHKRKILHRDIKPENVLIDKNGNMKLCDFGFCAPFGENFLRQTFCGTREYLPPEMLNSSKQDEKVDIWCLGILLFELTHFRTPFTTSSTLAMISEIKAQRINYKSSLHPEFKSIISLCLQYDPRKRPSAEQLLNFPIIKNAIENHRNQRLSQPQAPQNFPPTLISSSSQPQLMHNHQNLINSRYENAQFSTPVIKKDVVKPQTIVISSPNPPQSALKKSAAPQDNLLTMPTAFQKKDLPPSTQVEYKKNPKTGYFERVKIEQNGFPLDSHNRNKSADIFANQINLMTLSPAPAPKAHAFPVFQRSESLKPEVFEKIISTKTSIQSIKSTDDYRPNSLTFDNSMDDFANRAEMTRRQLDRMNTMPHFQNTTAQPKFESLILKKQNENVSHFMTLSQNISKPAFLNENAIQKAQANFFDDVFLPGQTMPNMPGVFKKPSKSIDVAKNPRNISPNFAVAVKK